MGKNKKSTIDVLGTTVTVLSRKDEDYISLNVALFGQTAKQWRDVNPKLEGNMRESPDAADQIREVLSHGNYLSQRDIEIRLGFDAESRTER